MNEIIIREDVPFEVREKQIGTHLIEIVLTDEGVFRVKQMQRVGDRWISSGCNWYNDEQMRRFADAALCGVFGKVVRRGRADLIEYDDENLRGERYLSQGDSII